MTQFYCLILLPEGEAQAPAPQLSCLEFQGQSEIASRYLKLRASRSAIADAHALSDPVWDILLDLFVCRVHGRNVTVTSACRAARRPSTTSLRYIDRLLSKGLLYCERDARDDRKVHLKITDSAFHAVAEWIDALHKQIAAA